MKGRKMTKGQAMNERKERRGHRADPGASRGGRTEPRKASSDCGVDYRAFFEHAKDAMYVVNEGGIIVDCNPKALEVFGRSREEVVGKTLCDLSPPFQPDGRDSKEKAFAILGAVAEDKAQTFEWTHCAPDGTLFDAEVIMVKVGTAGGAIFQAIASDVTPRKKVEEAVWESEEKFRLLFEKSTDPALLLDNDQFIDCNEAALKILCCPSKDRLIGLRPADLSPERQPDGALSSDKAKEVVDVASREGFNRFEWVHRAFDGSDVWVDVSLTVIPFHGRQIHYNVWRDISQRKLAEAALQESRQKYQCIYDNVAEGMFRTDAQGRLVSANGALARMYGFAKPEDLIETAWNLNKVYVRPKDRKLLNKLLAEKGVARNLETELYTRDGGTRWARMSVRAEKDEEGNIRYYEGTLEDVTEKKWAEEKYRDIFMNATEGIFQLTPEGHCFNANPALARIHGFDSPKDLIGYAAEIPRQLHVDEETWRTYLERMNEKGYVRDQLWRMYRKDGSIAWLSVNARVVRDEGGHVLYHEGTVQDITEKKLAVDQILIQRDLALRLAQANNVADALALTLETALKASGMECGGIWLKRRGGEDLELISSTGFSPRLERKTRLLSAGSPSWSRMMSGNRIVAVPSRESMPNAYEEGYKYAVVVPILHEGRAIGSVNLYSRTEETVPQQALIGLEFLAGQLGSIIGRIRVQQELEQEITTRREAEQALHTERKSLEEANIALKVLLRQREKDKEEMEQRLLLNVSELVIPYVEKLKKGRLDGLQRTDLEFVETNLKEILSPFLYNVRNFKLTPRQLEIVALIKQGKTTKEIAEALSATKDAIDKQRFIIRKKLGANKGKINLRSLLLSL